MTEKTTESPTVNQADAGSDFLKPEYVEKEAITAPPLKDSESEAIPENVNSDIDKQLGVKSEPEANNEGSQGSDSRKTAYNVNADDIYYQQLSELINNVFKVGAELLGDKGFENTEAENEVLTRIIYRYTGGLKGETLDAVQFVLVIFVKILRIKETIKKIMDKRANKDKTQKPPETPIA